LVQRQGELLILTEQGRQFADAAIVA